MPGEDATEAERSLRIIEQGGLPPAATARLQENASRQGTPQHLFTSNVSVNELLLTHECGYEPLGQVMGTTVYHMGWQWMPGQTWGSGWYNNLPPSQELEVLTQAYLDARSLTFGRLRQEAALLHADGVVGVRFERIADNLPEGCFEFKAVGTAVRRKGAPPPAGGDVFLSNLNGQDHWSLRKAGMRPVGFVFGNCSWYQVSGWRNQMLDQGSWVNRELPDFTQAMYNAREIALERMEVDAGRLGARGVVGVVIEPLISFYDVDQGSGGNRRDLIIQFTVFGTAIDWEAGRSPDFQVVPNLPLTDPQGN